MNNLSTRLFLCVLILSCAMFGTAGQKPQPATQEAAASDKAKPPKIDPCALLTSAEIQSVQGEPVAETKPSVQPGGGLEMAQCLFRTPTAGKAVSLAVASPLTISPRSYWMKQFHASKNTEKKKEKLSSKTANKSSARKEEEDDEAGPRAISGVGEQAYWVGGPIAGALYVLRGNRFLRISVGGEREESKRIQKSVTLARAALKRM
jgi:hypothetical protein